MTKYKSTANGVVLHVVSLFMGALVLLVSCGGSLEDVTAQPGPQAPAINESADTLGDYLPAPGVLKSVFYTEAGIAYRGADFIAEFPHQHVEAVGPPGHYTPTWSGSGAGFGDLAFAIYEFDLEDYDRDESVRLT